MPWYQERLCEDCGHQWHAVDVTPSVTVGTIDWEDDRTFTLHSCPRCHLSLRVQREVDGNSWRHWRSGLRPVSGDPSDTLITRVSDRIAEILSAGRTIYQPVVIELGVLNCAQCEIPLIAGRIDLPSPACPECRSPRVSDTSAGGHVQLFCEPPPTSEA